jgi:hypothetical protein
MVWFKLISGLYHFVSVGSQGCSNEYPLIVQYRACEYDQGEDHLSRDLESKDSSLVDKSKRIFLQ